MSKKISALLFAFTLFFAPGAEAAFNLSLLNASTLNGALPDDVAKAAIKTFGIVLAHRPYDGAVSMFDDNDLDLKLEVTMVKISGELNSALAANNMSSNSTANTAALPMPRVHIRKPFSPDVDMGFSFIYYQGQYTLGTDLKIELETPEEGINTALRLGYSYATATVLYLKSVHVFSPEFVMSRKIESCEPYVGFGGRIITGKVSVPFHLPPQEDFTVEKSATGYTAYAYTGVKFNILGPKGFRLGMEGAYDVSGFSSIGLTFGIGF